MLQCQTRRFFNALGRRLISSVPNPIPASFLRGGTSKGIFINRRLLPADRTEWTPIFAGIMGSPDPDHARQLNGMGGGISSLSKICVVGEPSDAQRAEGIDVEYTFCQVGIRDVSVDYSGNCGNLSSMIGVFAVDEGLCTPRPSDPHTTDSTEPVLGTVRAYNTNTNKRIDTTFPISRTAPAPTAVLDLPQTTMAGVPGLASRIQLDFVSPAGSRTGSLLPTTHPLDTASISHRGGASLMRMSLVDATNPTVFISALDLARALGTPVSEIQYGTSRTDEVLERTRRRGAELMGLDPDAQAQPKIAVLSVPPAQASASADEGTDIEVHALSMGVLHKAIPMTVGLCVSVAAGIKGTLAWKIVREARAARGLDAAVPPQESNNNLIRILHPSGIVEVGAQFAEDGQVRSAHVIRTGRRLMRGEVWW